MKKILFIAAAAALTASCTNRNAYTISGTAADFDGQYMYMCDYASPDQATDSVEVRNGKFVFKGTSETSEAVVLRNSGEDDTRYMLVFIEPAGKVTVDFDNKIATGTPANDAAVKYREQANELEQRYYDSKSAEEREAVVAEMDALRLASFEANSDNIFGATHLSTLSYEMTGAQTLAAIEALPEHVRNSKIVDGIRANAEAKLASDPGQPYIEVSQPDMEGNTVTLSSVVENPKNKYVLVDFWASWCGPCMMEVPYLIDAYAEYHDKGFEIFGISHDTDGERWRNCVKDRGMKWIHVSELHRFDNQAAKDYAVRAIPSNFLVDTATGKIIATNLRGDAVAAKLAELLD